MRSRASSVAAPRPSWATFGAISVMLALGCSGCGGGGTHRSPPPKHHVSAWRPGERATLRTDVCTTAGRRAVARVAGVPASAVRMRRAEASTAAAECIFHAGALVLSVSVNGAPQPYAVIDRQDVETSQYWGQTRWTPAPQPVAREGAEAFWFPGTNQLLTTEGVNLITATVVHWPRVAGARRRDACAAAARPYLGRIETALLRGPAP